jgi:hypothetical protein
MTCKRSAGYYIALKRELCKPKTAQAFGKIIHKALEKRYRDFGTYLGADASTAMTNAVTEEFQSWTPEDDDYRNYATAVSVIKQYAAQYQLEDFEPYRFPNGQLFVELPFAKPLGQIKIAAPLWVRNPDGTIERRTIDCITVIQKGKIDLVYRREGNIYGLDHKTTSVLGPQYFNEYELASQIHCYAWAINKIIGELPRGYVINALGVRKPTKTGKALEFIRQTIRIYPELVAEWEVDTMQLTAEFIEGCRTNQLPKSPKWCIAKYGACEFRQVCGLEPKLRSTSLYSNEYRDVTWDPLKE